MSEIMEKPNKTRQDYYDFLRAREDEFVRILNTWGFVKPATRDPTADEGEIYED